MIILKNIVKLMSNIHLQGKRKNIILFATPRGGSTWFMQLITSQPGFRYCDEPLDMRSSEIRKYSCINDWSELYDAESSVKIKRYFTGLMDGSLDFRNPNPFKPGYRLLTNRVVLKVIHGSVDRINWLKNELDVKVLYCLRHPIAVAMSRKELPFLDYFLTSDLKNRFTREQTDFAAQIINAGTHLDKGVLAWCIHNSIPLQDISSDWAVATYEQAVVDPAPVVNYLCAKLELDRPDLIYKQLNVPSPVVRESDDETRLLLNNSDNRSALIEKWKKKISDDDEKKLMNMLKIFEIDAYTYGSFLPVKKYWINNTT